VAQDCIISEDDCSTIDGIYVSALMEGERLLKRLVNGSGKSYFGRDSDPFTGEVLIEANQAIDEFLADEIDRVGIEKSQYPVRIDCKSKHGVCARCYGRSGATTSREYWRRQWALSAAQSIGEPGTQLTMRTFHIGGTAKFEEHSTLQARHDGKVKFFNLNTVKSKPDAASIPRERPGGDEP